MADNHTAPMTASPEQIKIKTDPVVAQPVQSPGKAAPRTTPENKS
ncbi:MAG: hypothetical protein ACREEE_05800 [Dongiaceae bacterium]